MVQNLRHTTYCLLLPRHVAGAPHRKKSRKMEKSFVKPGVDCFYGVIPFFGEILFFLKHILRCNLPAIMQGDLRG